MALDNPSPYTAQILAELEIQTPIQSASLAELEIQNLVNYHQEIPHPLFRSYLGSIYGVETLADLVELPSIAIVNKGLESANIEYCRNATDLRLNGNQLTDIGSVAALVALTFLNLGTNQLTDIGSVAALVALTDLRLNSNELTDIGSVAALVNLTELYLYGNQLTDIGSVAALVALTDFHLYGNQFSQTALETIIDEMWTNRAALGALSCDIQLQNNPGSALAAASRASEIADIELEGSSVTI